MYQMKIAITGASGYIGGHLTRFLQEKGHEIVPIGRDLLQAQNFDALCRKMEGAHVIVNLAGASISKRWTKAYKKELYDSRIPVTRRVVEAIHRMTVPPPLFISASAAGYYPDDGEYDEYNAKQGKNFLAHLCADWEKEARRCPPPTRLVIARFGIVLSEDGGALQQMLHLQRRFRTGTVIGNGQQYFPWISVHDLCRSFDFIIQNKQLKNAVNLVAPEPITQKHLADVLARADGIRWKIRLPGDFSRLLFGERGSFLTKGQHILPAKLSESGFTYLYPTLEKLMGVTDHRTVRQLNINRYMGVWHEIARYATRFERGLTNVTATYTLLPDHTIRVENEGLKGTSPRKTTGRAKQPDPENNPGQLKVAFFLWFYADYYIFELDEDYRYVVVGSSSDKYLWILSREKTLPPPVLDKLLHRIKDRGYDTAKLLFAK